MDEAHFYLKDVFGKNLIWKGTQSQHRKNRMKIRLQKTQFTNTTKNSYGQSY